MTDAVETRIALCRQCKTEIPIGAKICSTCNSYQDWRSFIQFSNTALALIIALISVAGISGPVLYKIVHTPRSEASITMPSVDGTTLSRLLKYSPTEAAFLHLRGSRHKVYRIVQFQREFHACSAV
ncbi:hypothetical protein [Paraburkholderia terricola]|uniref:hypothetical protein n=1 Tax=Paraburkholderia terricola TaxID=169427 RepID=UPI00115FA814|nr:MULTISPECIES: hypothetical protein [Paraburkholderia]